MFSSGAQWVLASWFVFLTVVPPIARAGMIANGIKGFSSSREYWTKWAGDAVERLVFVAVLYWGGFWA